jgi:hypothetical protein
MIVDCGCIGAQIGEHRLRNQPTIATADYCLPNHP